ncbi:hypothetical protein GCM10025868_00540 [Angustibacter aerolatus]|uniref:Haloacid dehalogenase n=1 Tax=Angustibacter aerolatus TaxID=1162965 RepID=A0ABQ6JBI2_9ACTN|nr:hypothetical protein GCM10025868_00540 [Angustibacter aerolatus]
MSWTSLAQTFLDAVPPGTFEVVVTGDRVTRGKPHPEPYLAAAAGLGLAPAQCVAIEDSATGTASALAAGVPTLAVPHVVAVPRADGLSFAGSLADVTPSLLGRIAAGEVLDLIGPPAGD